MDSQYTENFCRIFMWRTENINYKQPAGKLSIWYNTITQQRNVHLKTDDIQLSLPQVDQQE